MDALKLMTEGMIKENKPEFNVGDTCSRFRSYQGRRARAYPGF